MSGDNSGPTNTHVRLKKENYENMSIGVPNHSPSNAKVMIHRRSFEMTGGGINRNRRNRYTIKIVLQIFNTIEPTLRITVSYIDVPKTYEKSY